MVVFDVSEWSDVDEFDETVRSVIEVVLFARVEEVVAFGKVVVFVNESTDNNKTNSFLQHVSTGKRISNVCYLFGSVEILSEKKDSIFEVYDHLVKSQAGQASRAYLALLLKL